MVLEGFPEVARRPLEERTPAAAGVHTPGYVGLLPYDLGAEAETVQQAAKGMCWIRYENALIFDHESRRWDVLGNPPLDAILENLARSSVQRGHRVGGVESVLGRDGYTRAVSRGIEYIRAGDVYQVNLAHELRGAFSGSTRSAFAAMASACAPAFGAYLELPDAAGERCCVLSLSPELFLDVDGDLVSTRPMKGTRPGSSDPRVLERSEKDRAELNMIIDLMRNDLGRVCRFGTIRVDAHRSIERHGKDQSSSILQATGVVSGRVRGSISLADVMHAAFPGGSITGAPKLRAMQIIEELEVSPRGIYCGSIGYIDDAGRSQFNIAIRTAIVKGSLGNAARDDIDAGTISFRVGAGIVADSDPGEEWSETLVKAAAIRSIATIKDDTQR